MTRTALAIAAVALAGCAASAPPVAPPAPPIEAAPPASSAALLRGDEAILANVPWPARTSILQRRQVSSTPFRVADLPEGTVPEPVTTPAPRALPEGPDAEELVIDKSTAASSDGFRSVKIGILGRGYARLRVGYSEASFTLGEGGLRVTCGGPVGRQSVIMPARWEVMERVVDPSGDHVVFRAVNAWFDMTKCKGTIIGRGAATPKAILEGALYAFRRPCVACEDRESVVFLAPPLESLSVTALGGDASSQGGSFTRVVLPVRRGGGAALMGRLLEARLRDWSRVISAPDILPTDIVIGVDMAQGVDDLDPVAIAYMGAPSWARRASPAPAGSNR